MKQNSRAALAIHLLGPFRVSVSGKSVEEARWPRPQAKLLLKLLALDSKHQLHRQQIIDAVWPELDEESGAANLHKIIHMARRALEPKLKSGADSQFILTRDQQVQLAASRGLWIDAEQFEESSVRAFRSGAVSECEAALALYGGDLLSEDLYADWCTRRRDQLRAMHQEVLMKLGSLYAAQGHHKPAIVQFERLLAAEPSNEEAHRELMRLYVLTGRRSEALRQFRRCCDAIRTELDAEPEEATLQLHRKILTKELRALPQIEVPQGIDAPIDTIAVLPFHNDTGDPSLTYLSSGIAESLIKNLSQLPRLRVLGWGLYYARRYDQAIDQLRRTLELDANFAVAYLMLGLAYAQNNCLTEALAGIQKSIELSGNDPFALAIGALGYVCAVSGRKSEALSAIERVGQLKNVRYAADYCQALVLSGLGDRTRAIDRLESAFEQRYDRLIYLNVEPIFDGLRDDPRFQNLIRRIGL